MNVHHQFPNTYAYHAYLKMQQYPPLTATVWPSANILSSESLSQVMTAPPAGMDSNHFNYVVDRMNSSTDIYTNENTRENGTNVSILDELLNISPSHLIRWDTSFTPKKLPEDDDEFFVSAWSKESLKKKSNILVDEMEIEMNEDRIKHLKETRIKEKEIQEENKNMRKRKRKRQPETINPIYRPITPDIERKANQKIPKMSSIFDTGPFTNTNTKKQKESLEVKKKLDEIAIEMEKEELPTNSKPISLEEEGILSDVQVHSLWCKIAREEIRLKQMEMRVNRRMGIGNCRTIAYIMKDEISKRIKKSLALSSQAPIRAKKLSQKIGTYLRKNKFKASEQRKKKIAIEREKELQQRKLNYLLTRTELYSHFMAKRVGSIDQNAELPIPNLNPTTEDNEMQEEALKDVQKALDEQFKKTQAFDSVNHRRNDDEDDIIQDASTLTEPSIFKGNLKNYQKRGVSWLINLYEQGINGILADEMGLGKTVQTIAFLTWLAENKGIWGPFLVIAPKSTLPNWAREVQLFTDHLKILPYWGNVKQRTTLRKFMRPSMMYTKNASFHILITSYSLVVQDVKFFKKIKWEYMILDEAQAIKSAGSQRSNSLLNLKDCRNRLLLTGTPIQNNMAELWALLHFIMPTLFDNHAEFCRLVLERN